VTGPCARQHASLASRRESGGQEGSWQRVGGGGSKTGRVRVTSDPASARHARVRGSWRYVVWISGSLGCSHVGRTPSFPSLPLSRHKICAGDHRRLLLATVAQNLSLLWRRCSILGHALYATCTLSCQQRAHQRTKSDIDGPKSAF
jgi:hypothetical protein